MSALIRRRKRWSLAKSLLVVGSVGFLHLSPAVPSLAGQSRDEPAIAAAADLNAALPEIAALFQKQTGRTVRFSFGSSGAFTQQIENGAPFQIFLSADESYVRRLADAGRTLDDGVLYAIGRIGLFVPTSAAALGITSLDRFSAVARSGRITRFAIANPEHAPYGRAAQQALTTMGLWSTLQPRLVLGENASQATQFATSGSSQGGIIPLSLARTPAVQAKGTFLLIDESLHQPLRQRAVLLKNAGATAREFFAFLKSPEARQVLDQYGFVLPER